MIKKTLLPLLLASSLFATCEYKASQTKVTWTAFKTYEKVGVSGSFDLVDFQATPKKDIKDFLLSASAEIATFSVNSGHEGRDKLLVDSFFKVQDAKKIDAKIIKVEEKKLAISLTMNGITKEIPFSYSANGEKVEAKGVIDLLDFHMLPSLGAINKACYDLHEGKTWQDVTLSFEIKFTKNCD